MVLSQARSISKEQVLFPNMWWRTHTHIAFEEQKGLYNFPMSISTSLHQSGLQIKDQSKPKSHLVSHILNQCIIHMHKKAKQHASKENCINLSHYHAGTYWIGTRSTDLWIITMHTPHATTSVWHGIESYSKMVKIHFCFNF